ncbi:hypothetical protein [uncultured Nocardioides sp.]|uniref:hypothetical protein n=1 Tax=uncultured Nocardioides sp. TaxID=198441 RepID=UPI0025D6173A|nr:hypothetical protein [uncultured Nocardioides sp.]
MPIVGITTTAQLSATSGQKRVTPFQRPATAILMPMSHGALLLYIARIARVLPAGRELVSIWWRPGPPSTT